MAHWSGRARRRAPLLLALTLVAASFAAGPSAALAAGSIELTALDVAYTQDFDTLTAAPDGGTSEVLPNGWWLSETGTNTNTSYGIGTGSSNAGNTYSFGASGSTERAFGGLLSGSLFSRFGAQLTNSTGATITSLAISYTGEQWRLGQNTAGRAADRLDFELSTDTTSLTTGAWTGHDALDFASPTVAGTVGALNGNDAANRAARSLVIGDLSIAAGASIWIRWSDADLIPGADDGLAIDDLSITPDGVTPPQDDDAPSVASTIPVAGASNVAAGTSISVTFSEAVNVTGSWFTLSCATSGLHEATVTGGPVTFTLDPTTNFAFGETCSLTVGTAGITDQDGNDPPDAMVAQFQTGFSTELDPCIQPFTAIPAIQGSGPNAAITGTVTTQGVVVGDFEGTAAASGFYLQDAAGDGDAATSDGIFVFTGAANLVSVGDVVRVTGFARERFNQTSLNGSNSNTAAVPAAGIVGCGSAAVPAATDVTLPFAASDAPERYEGMLVRFPQDLVIAEYFNYDRFGEIVLARPLSGEPRPFSGTALDEPGAAANARTLANSLRRITLDDAQSAQNPPVLRHPNGDAFSLANRFRGGDHVENAVGVLGWDFNLYRIFPTGPADYTATNDRPEAPEPIGGTVRVAAMNTLNYFLTLDTTASDSVPGPCGGNANLDCRGADADQPDEFTRQRTKLLQALDGLDADIIGLNELENTPGVDPSGDLAAGLGDYAAISTGTIGTDAIKVGLIYRPDAVTPVGAHQTLDSTDDPRFIDTKSRPALAQTFEVNDTGARFTVVVNHLKSKGSDCNDVGDPDLLDGQGNCSQTRLKAAQALVDWLATDPTGSGDPDVLIMGDLNSYAKEQAIDAILLGADDTAATDDDFTNLIAAYQGQFAYSYTFDGQAGYLDHALANASILAQVKGAADWHINSDEPDILDYDTSFKPPAQEALYEPNQYRTSDHDPVIVGLTPNARPTVDAGGPYSVVEGGSVELAADGDDPNEGDELSYAWDLDGDGTFETAGRTPTFSAAGLDAPATVTVTVRVKDELGLESTDEATIAVIFDFGGFLPPVDPEAPSRAKAGSAIPLSFSLAGDHGLDIVADGSPTSQRVNCQTGAPIGTAELAQINGGLDYDAASDTYTLVWKTRKAWSGTCRDLTLELIDGTSHTATFRFAK